MHVRQNINIQDIHQCTKAKTYDFEINFCLIVNEHNMYVTPIFSLMRFHYRSVHKYELGEAYLQFYSTDLIKSLL
jgi:hypothetical protein